MGFWNFTNSVRNPDRLHGFSKVLKKFEGKEWISGHQIQTDFQISLIQHKLYLINETIDEDNVSFERAREIASGRWSDPPMRGRNSFSPLSKLGLCYLDENKKICLTDLGNKLSNDEIEPKDFVYNVLLKFQLPQHDEDSSYRKIDGFSIIPLIGTLQLIDRVNKLELSRGKKAKGISKQEFDLFIPTLINHEKIEEWATNLIQFRDSFSLAKTRTEKESVIDKFQMNLSELSREEWISVENKNKVRTIKKRFKEYGDNIRRYFRMTGWIHLRGNGYYIDHDPRKKLETDLLLSMSSKPKQFDNDEKYSIYLSDQTQPQLPWKTKEKLIDKYLILSATINDISSSINKELGIELVSRSKLQQMSELEIEQKIQLTKSYLQKIDKAKQEQELTQTENISDVISGLDYLIKEGKGALELEYQITRGLIAIDDGDIKPNYPLGDDGQPLNTAPGGAGDIECFYANFNMLCEVTMLSTAQQWMNEGQPVTRHYREFSEQNPSLETYCLFVAPKLHPDTVGQFWFENNRSGSKQTKIIPITISQFVFMLKTLNSYKERSSKNKFHHENLLELYRKILATMSEFEDETDWRNNIQNLLESWKQDILNYS